MRISSKSVPIFEINHVNFLKEFETRDYNTRRVSRPALHSSSILPPLCYFTTRYQDVYTAEERVSLQACMACTPKKAVQFATDEEVKEFVYGSPYSEGSSTDSVNDSSTLAYINSQLVAHGFARGSGVSFDGLSRQDADRLSKCMLGMLGQRSVRQAPDTIACPDLTYSRMMLHD